MYLDEMGIWLYQQYTIHVSDSTISRVLKREKISWKVLLCLAAERNATLRADWLARLTAWEPEWIMFVDESAANERSADRKRGWAPIGISAEHFVPVKKSMRWSILPCYTLDGYIAWETSAKKIPPHVLHTYLPVPSSNTSSPHPSYPSCIQLMF